MTAPAIAVIVGPTASGKSSLALALAQRIPLEIMSADSRQLYRGMDVGTAKPTAAQRAAVQHHLLDVADPDETFTLAQWVAAARRLVPQIAARGRLPLVVGGTGLYVNALVDGFDLDSQPWSPELRARLADELQAEGLEPLAGRLARLAPLLAEQTDLRNPRRVLRALERVEQGDTALPAARRYAGAVTLVGLERPREVLARRIEARARAMFADGLLEETQQLLDAGYGPQLPAMSGHGYAEATRVLAGEWDVATAAAETVRRTRHYAKRQMTWFGRDRRIHWLAPGGGPADSPQLVARVAELLDRTAQAELAGASATMDGLP